MNKMGKNTLFLEQQVKQLLFATRLIIPCQVYLVLMLMIVFKATKGIKVFRVIKATKAKATKATKVIKVFPRVLVTQDSQMNNSHLMQTRQ
jgi:hypothetical protein